MTPSGSGYYECETIDPRRRDGSRTTVRLSIQLARKYLKLISVDYMNLGLCAKEVLDDPQRIFEGVRGYEEGGWCYTGRPSEIYVTEGVTAPFQERFVYAVYVSPSLEIYWWCPEKCDPQDPLCPLDWQNRYDGGLIWTNTS